MDKFLDTLTYNVESRASIALSRNLYAVFGKARSKRLILADAMKEEIDFGI